MNHSHSGDTYFQAANPKRHKLIRPQVQTRGGLDKVSIPAINTVESLKAHLQVALKVEHSTIPPYLCALYSIKEGTNVFASQVIRSVAVEEMLHMILVANILNAIGGEPSINAKDFVPPYPAPLPHSDESFTVGLTKFSKTTIDTFLKIELPAESSAPPQADKFHTIGQFYAAVQEAIEYLEATTEGGIFIGDPSRQVTPEHYYGSGGDIVPVHDLESAITAIEEIVGQGEGIDNTIINTDQKLFGEDIEYAHYFRFNEIKYGQKYCEDDSPKEPPHGTKVAVEWEAVQNMKDNPKMSDYEKGSELWQKSYDFNLTYMQLLDNLHNACNGKPEMLIQGITLMYSLRYKASELMKIPIGDGTLTAGPSFEYIDKESV